MNKRSKRRIAVIMTVWLSVIIIAAYAVSAVLTYISLSKRAEQQTLNLIEQNVEDVTNDISEVSEVVATVAAEQWVKDTIKTSVDIEKKIDYNGFVEYCTENSLEINVVNKDGKIVISSDESQMGKNISEIEKFAEFDCLLGTDRKEYSKPSHQAFWYMSDRIRKWMLQIPSSQRSSDQASQPSRGHPGKDPGSWPVYL